MKINPIHCGLELIIDDTRSVEVVCRDLLEDFEPMKYDARPRANILPGDKFDRGIVNKHHAWSSSVVGKFVVTKRWILERGMQ